MMDTSASLVLLTGATGYLGFAVLVKLLKAGYRVRAAVRSIESAKQKILNTPSFTGTALSDNLSFVLVPDILAPNAYEEAVKGVDYVIHHASPITGAHIKDYQKELIEPARLGTIGMLEAVVSEHSIKRLIITSSILGNALPNSGPNLVTNAHTRIPFPEGPYGDMEDAYTASKVAALNASEDFVSKHEWKGDLISIHPGWIIGRNELATTPQQFLTGTATTPIRAYVGQPRPLLTSAIDLQDVSRMHVACLDPKIKGNRSYGATYEVDWTNAWSILEKHFPEAIEKGIFTDAEVPQEVFHWDASESEAIFGIRFRPFEETVIEVAQEWLMLNSS